MRKALQCTIIIASGFLAFTSSGTAHATLFDLEKDWSNIANPNGTWSIREGNVVLPSVSDWTPISNDVSVNGSHVVQPAWAFGDTLPGWFKAAITPVVSQIGSIYDYQAGDIIVHTTGPVYSDGHSDANVLWTSPSSGIAHIFGNVWDARTNLHREEYWDLLINGQMMASGYTYGSSTDGVSRAHPESFDFKNISLNAGDTVQLWLSRVDIGDFEGVNLSIDLPSDASAVPAPSALLLLLTGLTFLGFRAVRS